MGLNKNNEIRIMVSKPTDYLFCNGYIGYIVGSPTFWSRLQIHCKQMSNVEIFILFFYDNLLQNIIKDITNFVLLNIYQSPAAPLEETRIFIEILVASEIIHLPKDFSVKQENV